MTTTKSSKFDDAFFKSLDKEPLPDFEIGNPEEEFRQHLIDAKRGSSVQQFNLAMCYAHGSGTQKDMVKAIEWLEIATDNGENVSPYFLGNYYAKGEGVEQDFAKAVEWYKKPQRKTSSKPNTVSRIAMNTA